jgi:hypothetical protein
LSNLVIGKSDNETEDQVARESQHHNILAAETIAEIGSKKDTWESQGAEQQSPFAGLENDIFGG